MIVVGPRLTIISGRLVQTSISIPFGRVVGFLEVVATCIGIGMCDRSLTVSVAGKTI